MRSKFLIAFVGGFLFFSLWAGYHFFFERPSVMTRESAPSADPNSDYLYGAMLAEKNRESDKFDGPEAAYHEGRFLVTFHMGSLEEIEAAREKGAKALSYAAERGHAKASFELAKLYESGRGVPRDLKKAEEWYLKAAERASATDGETAVHTRLCTFFTRDWPNPPRAFKSCSVEAKYGSVHAQAMLSGMYFSGKGVEKDYLEAYFWLRLANYWAPTWGFRPNTEKEKKYLSLLSEAQRASVDMRVKEWMPEVPPEMKTQEHILDCKKRVEELPQISQMPKGVKEKCMLKCSIGLRPPDPRFYIGEDCPYWKTPTEK